jgi:serine/threonine-protein kinase RsbW
MGNILKVLDIYNKCIPSSINRIGDTVVEVISSIEKSYGPIDESTLFDLKVILNEIVMNAVKHGNREDVNKLVKVHAGINSNGYALIVVEDEGGGYDYGCLCRGHGPKGNGCDVFSFQESGRGIMLVNSLCDRVKVNARGNRIMVVKKLTGVQL